MTHWFHHEPSAQLVNQYLSWMQDTRRRSPNTVYSYRQTYVALLEHLGGKPMVSATLEDLQSFVLRPRRGGPPSDATVKREVAALRALFRWLGSRGHLRGPDPTLVLQEEAPKVHNDEPRPVDVELWRQLWFGDLTDDERVALGLACFCGLRRAEVTGLRPDQFVDVPVPRIVGVKRKGGQRQGLRYTSCVDLYGARLSGWVGDTEETFYGPLRRLREARTGRLALLPWADERHSAYVTRTKHRVPPGFVNPDLFNKRMRRAFKRNGMDPHSFGVHALRHAFCTNLVSVGVPIEVVSELAGHSSLDITRRYVKLADDPLRPFIDTQEVGGVREVNRW